MKTITDHIQIPVYRSKLFDLYFGGKSFAVFDIETTGLSPANSKVVLTGILKVDVASITSPIISAVITMSKILFFLSIYLIPLLPNVLTGIIILLKCYY